MKNYKQTNMNLINGGDVDVIYSGKESSISDMDTCEDETKLVSGRFFWFKLIFIHLIVLFRDQCHQFVKMFLKMEFLKS